MRDTVARRGLLSGLGSPPDPQDDLTELLQSFAAGNGLVENEVISRVYEELHKLAAYYMGQERADHTMETTELVNEAYLRLTAGGRSPSWDGRNHFFAIAATIMRRILTDYARRRSAVKHGGAAIVLPFDEELMGNDRQCDRVVELNDALERLAEFDARAARVVELKFFGGMTEEEIAPLLRTSPKTVRRVWAAARAWLYGQLGRKGTPENEE